MKSVILLAISSLFLFSASLANECATAISTTCGVTVNGVTTGDPSTGTGQGTCTTADGTGGVIWYSITGDGGTWTCETVTTAGQYDTKIWVFSGTCGSLTCVTGNDDGGAGTLSLVNFATTNGATYYIAVGGFSGSEGNFSMTIASTSCGGGVTTAPGGITGGLQTWFDANTGASGTPVTSWSNIGPNTNITQLTSPNGGNLASNDSKANFNNIINTTGGFNGTFHAEVPQRTNVISGSGVTMYVAYQRQSYPDLSFNFHSSVSGGGGDSGGQWRSWGFRHGGLGSLFSNGTAHLYSAPGQAQMSENSGFVGMHGTENSAGGNTMNGVDMSYANIGTFYSGSSDMELSVGYWPGYGMSRGVMEAVLWDRDLSAADRSRVETYLALKYGITLGMNGTSEDYSSPTSGSVIWDQSMNTGYNNDIAGISRSDASSLDQRKSHSTHGGAVGVFTDIVTIANGTNFASPTTMGADDSHLIWGHNGSMAANDTWVYSIPTDNGETIESKFLRVWKSQETGTVGSVTLEFDMSAVIGPGGVPGANDLSAVRLLVDEDGDFTSGATSIAPSSFNNTTDLIYFVHDFIAGTANPMDQNRGFFFTLGSTDVNLAPLPVELVEFDVVADECSNLISWSTASETNNDYFTLERSYDMSNWELAGTVDGAGNSNSQLDYLFRDLNVEQNGIIYYRIGQVDVDGKQEYIHMKAVNHFCKENIEPIAYPNPMDNQLSILTPTDGFMTLTDLHGRVLMKNEIHQGEEQFDVSALATGAYLLQIDLVNDKHFTMKFVKR